MKDNTYFGKFIVSLLSLFSTDKQLLEDRGAFIVRYAVYFLLPFEFDLNVSSNNASIFSFSGNYVYC